jgi:signal transduction histidine kinase
MARNPIGEQQSVFDGDGELARRLQAFDWEETSLGPVEAWPQSLKTCVRIMLTSRQPMFVWWGDDLINLYNDAYRSILQGKHPTALGQPAAVVWREIWDQVGPRAEQAMRRNEGTYDEALLLIMERNGYPEETYYTFSYSPVPNDQGGTGGIICANTEDTARIVGERQLALLRELASKAARARTWQEACALSAACLDANPRDLPFAMIYVVDRERRQLVLTGTSGIAVGQTAAPSVVPLDDPADWPFAEVLRTNQVHLAPEVAAAFAHLPTGAWNRPISQAVALPISASGPRGRSGVLVVGLNPYRPWDDRYRGFLEVVASQIAASIANAQAYEEERQRAEALAELDRAKTTFFSNISHEFRTPLTLMLGPVEDLLAKPPGTVLPVNRAELVVVHRNGQRLLKLVNTLLDFARIEAGRVQVVYEPTDLAQLTRDLASSFRSATDRAGLRLVVDCPALPEPVYVDRDMWEKIVLNLISNAFKFTFEGDITVTLRPHNQTVELEVRDTGVGIPATELPHLFERFHRVEGARARTHEGSGIGLALVQELVHLHGGTVRVHSELGVGSAFTVSIPTGTDHLPAERVQVSRARQPTGLGAAPFVEEALRWLPDAVTMEDEASGDRRSAGAKLTSVAPTSPTPDLQSQFRPRVIVADDNADMRDYIRRLLGSRYQVEAVADGVAAWEAARTRRPALVLADVMMPTLDGFGLLKRLREDPETTTLPIILLSARAGEEARVEGLRAGADDYLVKPFSARELLARVDASLQLAEERASAARALREAYEHLNVALAAEQEARAEAEAALRARDEFLSIAAHELKTPVTGIKGSAQLLARALDRGILDEQRLRRSVATIVTGTDRLAALTTDLLDVARIQTGRLELDRTWFDLGDLVRSVVDRFRDRLDHRHQVQLELIAPPYRINADAGRIEQVLVNLLDNAVKYSPGGGAIVVAVGRGDGQIELRVRDSGIGLPPDALESIFEPFERAANAARHHLPGMGLGLHICRTIVERHGGTLRAESPGEDQGTTLIVTLPSANPPEATVESG